MARRSAVSGRRRVRGRSGANDALSEAGGDRTPRSPGRWTPSCHRVGLAEFCAGMADRRLSAARATESIGCSATWPRRGGRRPPDDAARASAGAPAAASAWAAAHRVHCGVRQGRRARTRRGQAMGRVHRRGARVLRVIHPEGARTPGCPPFSGARPGSDYPAAAGSRFRRARCGRHRRLRAPTAVALDEEAIAVGDVEATAYLMWLRRTCLTIRRKTSQLAPARFVVSTACNLGCRPT